MTHASSLNHGRVRAAARALALVMSASTLAATAATAAAQQTPPPRPPQQQPAPQQPQRQMVRPDGAPPGVPGAAQAPPPAMLVGPQIQRIETAAALSPDAFGAITGVRELSDGRILVNDGTRRRLLMLDSALTTVSVVLDSLSEIAHSYGTRAGALLPWQGDTTLFVDPAAFAIVMLDGAGRIARVRSVWRVEDVPWFTSSAGTSGFPGLDGRGRMVYRVPARPAPPAVRPPPGVPYFPPQPDSAFIVAVDLDSRKADTLAVVRIPKMDQRIRMTGENRWNFEQVINPLPFTDQWAVLPDGVIAVIRGQDYRVEYLHPDGSITSSPKLPYEWQRLTDDDRRTLVDSVRTAQQRNVQRDWATAVIRWSNMYSRPYPAGFEVPEGYVLPPGMPGDWILPAGVAFPANYIYACPPGVEPTGGQTMVVTGATFISQTGAGGPPPGAAISVRPPDGAGAPPSAPPGAAGAPAAGMPPCLPAPPTMTGGNMPPLPTPRQFAVVQPDELPDYRPPLVSGAGAAVRADMEGNLWIRAVLPRAVPGGLVYDIVSRDGELAQRIQLPPGYTIVGFGQDRVVYLSMRDPSGIRLARVRLR
jgi:hypothetical protein